MKWAIQAKEEEKNKLQTFSADGWTGESKIFTNVVKKWARTPFSRAKNSKNKWAEWLGRGKREGDKGAKEFCPGWRHQSGQNGGPRSLLSRLEPPTGIKGPSHQPGQNSLAPLSPSLSPRSSHSAHLFLVVLGSGERSSYSFLHHICEDI